MKRKTKHVCQRCGKCCGMFGISLSMADMNREPRLWDVAVEIVEIKNRKLVRFMMEKGHRYAIGKRQRGASCVFLDANRECLIYGTRPDVCREFPGDSLCPREVTDGNA